MTMKRPTMTIHASLASTAAAGLLFLASSAWQPAHAQDQQFSDAELNAFTAALVEVQQISQDYADRIAEADTAAKQGDLREQANQEMAQAVRDNGLDIPSYNAIVESMRQNPQLAAEIESRMETME